jgi:hypothetical protein
LKVLSPKTKAVCVSFASIQRSHHHTYSSDPLPAL